MPRRSPQPTLSGKAYTRLRTDILSGRFPPGSKLNVRALALQGGVSLSVIREALTRLAEQRLVIAEPQLGFSVVSIDVDDLRDITRLRIMIEGTALTDAVLHGGIEYESCVVSAHHRMSRTNYFCDGSDEIVTDEWAEAHSMFHDVLISAAPSMRLRRLSAALRDSSELYRRWSGPFHESSPPRDVADEHRELVDAVLNHDAERAASLLTEHIRVTSDRLASYAEARLDTHGAPEWLLHGGAGDADAKCAGAV